MKDARSGDAISLDILELKFVQRVLESDAPPEDSKAARDIVVAMWKRLHAQLTTMPR